MEPDSDNCELQDDVQPESNSCEVQGTSTQNVSDEVDCVEIPKRIQWKVSSRNMKRRLLHEYCDETSTNIDHECKSKLSKKPRSSKDGVDVSDMKYSHPKPPPSMNMKRNITPEPCGETDSDYEPEPEKDRLKLSNTKSVSRKLSCKRVPWSEEEIHALKSYFTKFFDMRKPPDEKTIREAIAAYPILARRTVAQIKSRAWHCIQTGR